MKNKISTVINVKQAEVGILKVKGVSYISLTDLAKYKNKSKPGEVISKWMTNKNSFDFYCLWEEVFNEILILRNPAILK